MVLLLKPPITGLPEIPGILAVFPEDHQEDQQPQSRQIYALPLSGVKQPDLSEDRQPGADA